jgi:hypothetical protein
MSLEHRDQQASSGVAQSSSGLGEAVESALSQVRAWVEHRSVVKNLFRHKAALSRPGQEHGSLHAVRAGQPGDRQETLLGAG